MFFWIIVVSTIISIESEIITRCKYMPQLRLLLAIERSPDYMDKIDNGTSGETIAVNNSMGTFNDTGEHTVFTWISTFSKQDAPIIFSTLDDTETFQWSRQNVTKQEKFMRQHYWYMIKMALQFTDNNETFTITQMNYNCCYLKNMRTLCNVDQKVNNKFLNHDATNYSSTFGFDIVEHNTNSSDLWLWLNETVVSEMWPHINETLTLWSTFLDIMRVPDDSTVIYGSTRVIRSKNGTSTVECLAHAKNASRINLSWFDNDQYINVYNESKTILNDNIFESSKSVVTIRDEKVRNMHCYVTSKGKWGVMLPVPFKYGVLSTQYTVSFSLVMAVLVLSILFIMMAIAMCCLCVFKYCVYRKTH